MFNFIFAHIFFFLLPPDLSQVTPYDYTQVYENSVELMTDPFGNYLMQKLVERCTDEQRTVIAQKVRRSAPVPAGEVASGLCKGPPFGLLVEA